MPRPHPPGLALHSLHTLHRRARWCTIAAAALAIVFVAACNHNQGNSDDPPFPRQPPVLVHVINENYLDMNVAAVIGGVSRRLGDVTGNSTRDFTIDMSTKYGESVTMTARPIGGMGSFTSGALNIGSGQYILVHIGTSIRQSIAVLRDTL